MSLWASEYMLTQISCSGVFSLKKILMQEVLVRHGPYTGQVGLITKVEAEPTLDAQMKVVFHVLLFERFETITIDALKDDVTLILTTPSPTRLTLFPSEQLIERECFRNELELLDRYNIQGANTTHHYVLHATDVKSVVVRGVETQDWRNVEYNASSLVIEFLGKVVLSDSSMLTERFAKNQEFDTVFLTTSMPVPCESELNEFYSGYIIEGLCRRKGIWDARTKGIGKVLIDRCIALLPTETQLFLTVFNFTDDEKISNSHDRLVDYYSQLGFTEHVRFQHKTAPIQYTLMRHNANNKDRTPFLW